MAKIDENAIAKLKALFQDNEKALGSNFSQLIDFFNDNKVTDNGDGTFTVGTVTVDMGKLYDLIRNAGTGPLVTATDFNKALSSKADDSTVVHTADMRKPASDVVGIEEVSTLQTQVNNSAVGTNLLTGTSEDFQNSNIWIVQTTVTLSSIGLSVGDTVTLSAYLDLTNLNRGTGAASFAFTDSSNPTLSNIDGNVINAKSSGRSISTGTIPSNATYIVVKIWASGGGFKYKQMKLELGSHATDWCPNPEDKVNVSDMRKPASDVAGIEEVNAKQDKIGYTPADDSKVAHLSGANNFDTVPTVNNNPLLLASSLPSDLARTGSDQEFKGKNTFDTAPIDKTTGNPYITKSGVPAVPSTLADTTKDANFTGKLQKSGIDVATKSDVTTAVSTATANMVDSSKPTNFTAGLQSGGVDVATAADLKSIEDSAWRQLDNKYITPDSGYTLSPSTNILYKIDDSIHTLYLSGAIVITASDMSRVKITVELGSIFKNMKTFLVPYLGYTDDLNHWKFAQAGQTDNYLTFLTVAGLVCIAETSGTEGQLANVTYDKLV